MEAAACGLPVIAAKVGGLPEVVVHKSTGLLVEPENVEQLTSAIDRMLSQPEKMSEYGANGRDFVSAQYSWDACIDKMLNQYNQLV